MEFICDLFARLYFLARRAKMLAIKKMEKITKVLYCPKISKKTKKLFSVPSTCYIYTFMKKKKNISCWWSETIWQNLIKYHSTFTQFKKKYDQMLSLTFIENKNKYFSKWKGICNLIYLSLAEITNNFNLGLAWNPGFRVYLKNRDWILSYKCSTYYV